VSSAYRIDLAETALMTLLKENLGAAYGTPVQVDSLGDRDFDSEGVLILQPPCVRVRFMGAEYNNLRDNQRLTYQGKLLFSIWCFESSLRSKADERLQTLQLVAVVQDQLAGSRLSMDDGYKTMPISMVGVELIEVEQGAVDQLFSVNIAVESDAQFSGVNANANWGGGT
jgi:hypothetical protein